MKIENIFISDININNGTATLSFDVSETTDNVDIYLKINDDEFIKIATKQSQGKKTYTLTSMQKGVHNLILKISNGNEEYISEPFLAKFKNNPSIEGLKCIYTDSTGKFILTFNVLGDELFTYNINLKLDNNEYQEIMTSQIIGEKSFESINTMGSHTCTLKISDGYDEYVTNTYSFRIINQKPILSKVLVKDITNEGIANICYAVKDIENSILTHKLNINGTNRNINPTRADNFYTYEISGLAVGSHICNISISDGTDTVATDDFTIEIFANPTDEKETLRQAKVRYDFAYQNLKDIIMSVVSDGVFNYDVENTIIQKAQESYNETYSEFNKIAQQSIDIIGTNKVTISKDDLENQINDVGDAIDSLEVTMEGVFKDGILSDSEKVILEENLNLVAKEKSDVDKDYENLYNNEDLLNPAKSNLKTSYNNFVFAHNALVVTIDGIINKKGIIDNTDKANIDNAFETWREALGDYRYSSLGAIDSIAKKKADDSADVVDKKWAELILDPDTGIQAQVGNLTTTIDGYDERISDVEITSNGISSTVSSMQTVVNGFDNRISKNESNITQLSDKITSQVITDEDIKSIIEQSAEEIRIGFNDISDSVVINTNGLTVNQGSIACDILTVPSGHNPIIKLFPTVDMNGNSSYCSIDATENYEVGQGSSIRLKWDSMNYLLVRRAEILFFLEPREGGVAFNFQSDRGEYTSSDESRIETREGVLCFRGGEGLFYYTGSSNYDRRLLTSYDTSNSVSSASSTTVATSYAVYQAYNRATEALSNANHSHPYASSGHTHYYLQGDSSSYTVALYGGSSPAMYANSDASVNLGHSSRRWQYVYATNGTIQTSDLKYKDNVSYIDDIIVSPFSLNKTIVSTPFLDFIKNDYRPATFTYKTKSNLEENIADNQIGFIANDIIDTDVGQTFLYNYGTEEEPDYMFSPSGYTTVIGRALQEEIRVRENKIAELEARIEELEKKLNS